MKDTSDEINHLQLKIWLDKTPEERLHRMLVDNEAIYNFWKNVKPVPELDKTKNIK